MMAADEIERADEAAVAASIAQAAFDRSPCPKRDSVAVEVTVPSRTLV